MNKTSFIIRVPDRPGALHRAAEIIKRYDGNINRIQYDRRIDPYTVFFEVTASGGSYHRISTDLHAIGYLQTSLETLSFLKFYAYLPHRSGALFDFLNYITSSGANIAFIDFDDAGKHPDRLTVSLNLAESIAVEQLLELLKSRYRIEIVEYDTTGRHLDDTVFYFRFAQEIRNITGESEDRFLLQLLGDINHIAQELMKRGKDPKETFENILFNGKWLKNTTGPDFTADVQRIMVTESLVLSCFQLPGGGNVFLLETADERVMVDTGYGIYWPDVSKMLQHYSPGSTKQISRIVITHADADHCGAGGYIDAPSWMHPGTSKIIEENNRAYGSRSQDSILEAVYTTLISLFSRFNPPQHVKLFDTEPLGMRGVFPVISRFSICGLEFEVLESLGGHQYGQVYLLCREAGMLFTADTLINFEHLTSERANYNSLAVFLVTSVNVDSDRARFERRALRNIAAEVDGEQAEKGRRCLICCGHGPVSVLTEKGMEPYGKIERYHG